MVSPLELSSDVHIRVCASFEFSPMLGNGETLRAFVVGIEELLEHGEIIKCKCFFSFFTTIYLQCDEAIEFSPPEGGPVTPCSLLCITVERRSCTSDTLTPVSNRRTNIVST